MVTCTYCSGMTVLYSTKVAGAWVVFSMDRIPLGHRPRFTSERVRERVRRSAHSTATLTQPCGRCSHEARTSFANDYISLSLRKCTRFAYFSLENRRATSPSRLGVSVVVMAFAFREMVNR